MASHSLHPVPAAVRAGSVDSSATAEAFRRARGLAIGLLGVGAVTTLLGLWLVPDRIAINLFINSYYLLTLGLGGICFVAINYVAGAKWSTAIRRVPEALSGAVLPGAIGLFALFLMYPGLYSWRGEALHGGFKAFWLDWPFFLVRSLVYVAVWLVLIRAIVSHSRRQDSDGKPHHTIANRRLSALFIALFAVTFWLASFDWIMSLEPEWYSTLFAIYNFSGLFLSGLAVTVILVIWLSRTPPLRFVVTEAHLHDLGKLLFAFSSFWMYIWFSQYMLIWYAGIPEETVYFLSRARGAWLPLFLLTMVLNWAVPFVALMPRKTKVDPVRMVQVSAVILVGHWLDIYVMVFPALTEAGPAVGFWEAGIAAGSVGVLLAVLSRQLRKAPLVPVKDPFLAESLSPHL